MSNALVDCHIKDGKPCGDASRGDNWINLDDLKPMLFELGKSHSRLASAEYHRNPAYSHEHFSHEAERSLIAFLNKVGLLSEFLGIEVVDREEAERLVDLPPIRSGE